MSLSIYVFSVFSAQVIINNNAKYMYDLSTLWVLCLVKLAVAYKVYTLSLHVFQGEGARVRAVSIIMTLLLLLLLLINNIL